MKKFKGLVPAIVQDADSGMVLMLGYMNHEALQKTRATKKVWFYSRSKKRLWMKGETSGNTLTLVDARIDCDNDALLIKALPQGPTCHTGTRSCFKGNLSTNIFKELFDVIDDRKNNPTKKSYTSFLLKKGQSKICEKIAEESGEVIQAATKETKKRLIEESADLLYHLFVLLVKKDISLAELNGELQRRRKVR